MLKSIPYYVLQEWMHFSQLEPFGEVRADMRSAYVMSVIANVNRDASRRPKPYEIKDFMLEFDKEAKQTWRQQKALMEVWTQALGR